MSFRARALGSRKSLGGAIAAVAALALGVAALAPLESNASSHREAPLISNDPQADNTDVYAFVSPDAPAKVTLISNWIPFEEPGGGPNFYPFSDRARYDINVDNDGDGRADIIYRWKFQDHYRNLNTFLYNTGVVTSLEDPDLNFFQTYDLYVIRPGHGSRTLVDGAIAAPSFVGDASMPDYGGLRDQALVGFAGGGSSFAGQADDPFFLDLRIFDLLYGTDFSEVGDDTLAGFNVNTIALQVPKAAVAEGGKPGRNPIVGVWSSTARRNTTVLGDDDSEHGKFVQVSRVGMPLVNEVIIPLEHKDEWNTDRPEGDREYKRFYNDPIVPHVVNAVYGLPVPDSDPKAKGVQRADLIQVFLTGVEGLNKPAGNVTSSDELRLNMSIPPCEQGGCSEYSPLGVIGGDFAGFPNGRRLADDIVDVALQVMEGELLGAPNDLSDAVGSNDKAFLDSFPYVALPTSGSDPDPH
jgi:Domain of unknown function (DUF4331)